MSHPMAHLAASCSSRSRHNQRCQTKDKLRRRPAFTFICSIRKKRELPRWIKLSIHDFEFFLCQNLSFSALSNTQAHFRANAEAWHRLNTRGAEPIPELELNRALFVCGWRMAKEFKPLALRASGAEHRLRLTTSSRRFHRHQYSSKAKSPQTMFGG